MPTTQTLAYAVKACVLSAMPDLEIFMCICRHKAGYTQAFGVPFRFYFFRSCINCLAVLQSGWFSHLAHPKARGTSAWDPPVPLSYSRV